MDTYEYSELLKTLDAKLSNIVALIKPDDIAYKDDLLSYFYIMLHMKHIMFH